MGAPDGAEAQVGRRSETVQQGGRRPRCTSLGFESLSSTRIGAARLTLPHPLEAKQRDLAGGLATASSAAQKEGLNPKVTL